jgi:cell division protein FtsL
MRFVLILCAFGLMAMLTVWQHLQSVRTGYEITRLRRERNALAEANRRLELEADRLKSPENLLMMVEKLGLDLRPARPDEIIRLRSPLAE